MKRKVLWIYIGICLLVLIFGDGEENIVPNLFGASLLGIAIFFLFMAGSIGSKSKGLGALFLAWLFWRSTK